MRYRDAARLESEARGSNERSRIRYLTSSIDEHRLTTQSLGFFWGFCILATRRQIEVGFSHAVPFSGQRDVFPDKADPQSFGRIDWSGTLKNWRLLDPERFPIRLPGFTLIGGKLTLDALLPAAVYEQRAEIFRLAE